MEQLPTDFSFASEDTSHLPERQQRKDVRLPGELVLPDGAVLEVNVIDLSYDGCRLEVPKLVVAGEEVTLSVPGCGAIVATVRWRKGGRAGLRFHDEPVAKIEVNRAAERRPATVSAQLRRIGRLSYSVELRDISPEGCKIELVERPAVGEVMHVKLPGLETFETRVRWVEGYVAGLKFKYPIHSAVFAMLMDRHGS
ncbi:MAG: PilZ domain-containing protein [Sphingomicrobium sp.]